MVVPDFRNDVVPDFRVKEMAVCPSTNFIILGRIAYLLMVEVAILAFATSTDPKAKLPKFTACFGVGKFAGSSCDSMLATIVSCKESTEVSGFHSLWSGFIIISCKSVIRGSSFDLSVTNCNILDFHSGSIVNIGSIKCV